MAIFGALVGLMLALMFGESLSPYLLVPAGAIAAHLLSKKPQSQSKRINLEEQLAKMSAEIRALLADINALRARVFVLEGTQPATGDHGPATLWPVEPDVAAPEPLSEDTEATQATEDLPQPTFMVQPPLAPDEHETIGSDESFPNRNRRRQLNLSRQVSRTMRLPLPLKRHWRKAACRPQCHPPRQILPAA